MTVSIAANPLATAALALGAAAALASAARADGVAEFYGKKPIEILVGASPGGGYDLNARLVARHLGRHVPGTPTVLVKNLPGGASLRVANMLYAAASRDGGTLGVVSRSVLTMPLMGVKAAALKPAEMTWIGSVTNEDSICIASAKSKVKSWKDALAQPLIVGAAGPGASTYTYPVLLRNLFGAKFELIAGYPGGKDAQLAFERGEVEGYCPSLSSLLTQKPDWLKEKKATPLVLIGLKRNAAVPDTPSLAEIATSEAEKRVLSVILAPQVAGRPLLGPPQIPVDRVTALRAGFDKAMVDPALKLDAAKQGLELNPVSGAEIEALVRDVYATPADLVERAKLVVQKPQDMKVTIKEIPEQTVTVPLTGIKDGGRAISFKVGSGEHTAKVSGSRTKIEIAGKAAKRGDLKAGATCRITYRGDRSEASSINCR
ncbi:MAG: Bug family tripartite tricarboxylate transporter substrate binding protein [Hyphomicrobiaceae bacterium]